MILFNLLKRCVEEEKDTSTEQEDTSTEQEDTSKKQENQEEIKYNSLEARLKQLEEIVFKKLESQNNRESEELDRYE